MERPVAPEPSRRSELADWLRPSPVLGRAQNGLCDECPLACQALYSMYFCGIGLHGLDDVDSGSLEAQLH